MGATARFATPITVLRIQTPCSASVGMIIRHHTYPAHEAWIHTCGNATARHRAVHVNSVGIVLTRHVLRISRAQLATLAPAAPAIAGTVGNIVTAGMRVKYGPLWVIRRHAVVRGAWVAFCRSESSFRTSASAGQGCHHIGSTALGGDHQRSLSSRVLYILRLHHRREHLHDFDGRHGRCGMKCGGSSAAAPSCCTVSLREGRAPARRSRRAILGSLFG